VAERAEAAVIAWMRHQTTAYDNMQIARIKGRRREVRRELAAISRAVLDLHRRDAAHAEGSCPLCSQRIPPELP
jgi:16S rRNA U516 pseudouridylate synthase RsuA-like enzyme